MTQTLIARITPKTTYSPDTYEYTKRLIQEDLDKHKSPFYDIKIISEDNETE